MSVSTSQHTVALATEEKGATYRAGKRQEQRDSTAPFQNRAGAYVSRARYEYSI